MMRHILLAASLMIGLLAGPLATEAAPGDGAWMSLGPPGASINSLAISPNYPAEKTLLAATSGGLFKTTDGGERWTPASTGLTGPETKKIYPYLVALSPDFARDQAAFALTYGGLFKSTDGAATWQPAVAFPFQDPNSRLLFSPNYGIDKTMFAWGYEGGSTSPPYVNQPKAAVYRSVDGGATWLPARAGLPTQSVGDIAISPSFASDRTLFASTGAGFYRSENAGESWYLIGDVAPYPWSSLVVSPNYANDKTLFAISNFPASGVLKSTDGGVSWTLLTGGPRYSYPIHLTISPNFAGDQTLFAYAGFFGIYRSTDGGASWHLANNGLSDINVSSMVLSPGFAQDRTLFVGIGGGYYQTASGVFRSKDGGSNWARTSQGLNGLNVSDIATSPEYDKDGTLFVSSNGGLFRSRDRGQTWRLMELGSSYGYISGLALSPAFPSDGTLFASTYFNGVFKSTDRGETWQPANTGLSAVALRTTSLVMSPGFPADPTLFVRTFQGLFRSTDGGARWEGLPETAPPIYRLALSPGFAQDRTAFAAGRDGVFKSTDAGATWQALPFGIAQGFPYGVAISPDYPKDQAVFATMQDGRVLKSTDGGKTWALSQNSGSGEVALALSPLYGVDRTLFAAYKGKGVLVSQDGGQGWRDISQGLGDLEVGNLRIASPACPVLFAATERGVWKYPVSSCLEASPGDLTYLSGFGASGVLSQILSLAGREGEAITYTASLSPSVGWLAVAPLSGTTPSSLSASLEPGGLLTGTYAATIHLRADRAGNSPLAVGVKAIVGNIRRLYLPWVGGLGAGGW